MVGFLFLFLFVFIVSAILGGIPFIIWIIMVEGAGQMDYLLATTYLAIVLVEIIQFIGHIAFNEQINFSFKNLINVIKNFFKKLKSKKDKIDSKDNKKANNNKNKTKVSIKVIEGIVLIGILIAAIFYKPHSMVLNLIYDNLIVRIISMIGIPLIIINLINSYRSEKGFTSFGEIFGMKIFEIIMLFIFGIAISSTVFMLSNAMEEYNYIRDGIMSWFVYDNNEYDEIRAQDEFETEYDFLDNNFEATLKSLKEDYDIEDEEEYQIIKNSLYKSSDLNRYGYAVTDSEWESDYVQLICIIDRKTKENSFYKINYNKYSLKESSQEEFLEVRKENREKDD